MIKEFLNKSKLLLTTLTLLTLTACGSEENPDIEEPVIGENKTFAISASSVVIKRISNDEVIAVDISAIKSETLTLKDDS